MVRHCLECDSRERRMACSAQRTAFTGSKFDYFSFIYMDFTFGDVLYNPKIENDRLKLMGGDVAAAMTVQAYDGNTKYGTSLLRQTAETAMRFTHIVVKTLQEIDYLEDADFCFSQRNV